MMNMKKVLALLLCAVLLLPLVPAVRAAEIMGDESYERVAGIAASNGCGAHRSERSDLSLIHI